MTDTEVLNQLLAPEELTILNELIEHERRQLAVEIRRTDTRRLRDELEERRQVLERLQRRLGGEA